MQKIAKNISKGVSPAKTNSTTRFLPKNCARIMVINFRGVRKTSVSWFFFLSPFSLGFGTFFKIRFFPPLGFWILLIKWKNDQLDLPPGTPRKLFPSRKTYAFANKNTFLKSFRGVPFFPAYKIDMAIFSIIVK